MTALSHAHIFEPATDASRPPLLLLHGTGGDESQMIPFGRAVGAGAALLSARGQVVEGGMNRYFRRRPGGGFDEDDLRRRTDDLAAFVAEARRTYAIAAPVAVGLSNGANVAAALLQRHPGVLAGAVLLRVIAPFAEAPAMDLTGVAVLVLSGETDELMAADLTNRLVAEMRAAGAEVDHRILACGHGLTAQDSLLAADWLSAAFAR